MTSLKLICNKSELPESGKMIVKKVDNQSIIITKINDDFIGFQRRCPHGFMPLDMFGEIINAGNGIICKKHDYTWDLSNGISLDCVSHLTIFKIHVSELDVFIEIPTDELVAM